MIERYFLIIDLFVCWFLAVNMVVKFKFYLFLRCVCGGFQRLKSLQVAGWGWEMTMSASRFDLEESQTIC